MSAFGRKQTLVLEDFEAFERPLSGKADIQHESKSISAPFEVGTKWALGENLSPPVSFMITE